MTRNSMLRPITISLAAMLSVNACESPDDTDATTNALADATAYDLVERFRLGGAEPSEPEMFERVPLLLVDREERLYILHRARGDIAVFAHDGAFLHWIRGGRGGGPREFTSPLRMGFIGDTLWIRNLEPPRIVRFDREGTHLGTESVPLPQPFPGMFGSQGISGYMVGDRAWVEPDGALMAPWEGEQHVAALELGTRRTSAPRDTLLTWRSDRGRLRGLTFEPIPEPPFYALAPDGSAIAIVEWNEIDPARVALRIVDPDGADRWRTGLMLNARPISASERDSIVQSARQLVRELREGLIAQGVPPSGAPEVPSVTDVQAALHLPASWPPIAGVRVGVDGTIWLELTERGDGTRWLNVDPESGSLRTIIMPPAARAAQFTRNSVWYTQLDDLGIPWVVRADLEGS